MSSARRDCTKVHTPGPWPVSPDALTTRIRFERIQRPESDSACLPADALFALLHEGDDFFPPPRMTTLVARMLLRQLIGPITL